MLKLKIKDLFMNLEKIIKIYNNIYSLKDNFNSKQIISSFNMIPVFNEVKDFKDNVRTGKITLFQWLGDFFRSDSHYLFDRKDPELADVRVVRRAEHDAPHRASVPLRDEQLFPVVASLRGKMPGDPNGISDEFRPPAVFLRIQPLVEVRDIFLFPAPIRSDDEIHGCLSLSLGRAACFS